MDGHVQLICCSVDGESKLGWEILEKSDFQFDWVRILEVPL